eukprot:CAMPEP_0175343084 /NCGR_PEP_ID=MMETSP0095-20121207/7169_1 /TAXON_ID=311494 /ORGANISM="Alexandrium monilatum, Strain CCMP3105" /LENGTH=129 /DNA_ID=CAMNT_0016640509 /DNA_START=437 /DNA_END=826 /DNA_ORIENTATION=+
MAFLPLVTWYLILSTLYMPNSLRASFFNVLSGCTALLPPTWQAAQLLRKTVSPLATSGGSSASAGGCCAPRAAASNPSATPIDRKLQAEPESRCSGPAGGAAGDGPTLALAAAPTAAAVSTELADSPRT